MIEGVTMSGVPDRDQTRGMVTSLWVCCDCVGGYLGSTFGSMSYDQFGFEYSQLIMSIIGIVGVTTMLLSRFMSFKLSLCSKKQDAS